MQAQQSLIFLPEIDLADAEQGDAEAQYRVALYNREQKNYTEAVKWLQKAGSQNHAESLYTLAMLYETGEGIAQNTIEALKLYRKVAEQGYTEAKNKVMALYPLVNAKNNNSSLNPPTETNQPQEVIRVNAKDAWFTAANSGDLMLMKTLLNQGLITIHAINEAEYEAIHVAADKGHTAIVQFLIENGVSVYQWGGYKYLQHLPIALAASSNRLDVVKLLVNKGYDIKHTWRDGNSAISYVRTAEMLELFISFGVDISLKNNCKQGILEFAVQRGDANFYNILLQKGLKPTPDTLKSALRSNQFVLAKEISKIINIKKKDKLDNMTMLHEVATSASAEMINFLIDAGIDVNARTKTGETALFLATKNYCRGSADSNKVEAAVKALLSRGADYTIKCGHLDGTAFKNMQLSKKAFETQFADCITHKPKDCLIM